MKNIFLLLFYLLGFQAYAQEWDIISEMATSSQVEAISHGQKVHVVIISGAYRRLYYGEFYGELETGIVDLNYVSYEDDLRRFLKEEILSAQKTQKTKSPHVIVIEHQDALPGSYDKVAASTPKKMAVWQVLTASFDYKEDLKNVNVFTQKDHFSSSYKDGAYVSPLIKAINYLDLISDRTATFSTHLMVPNPEMVINQMRLALLHQFLDLGSRNRLNIRASGAHFVQHSVMPGMLHQMKRILPHNMDIRVTQVGKVRINSIGRAISTPGQAMKLSQFVEGEIEEGVRKDLIERLVRDRALLMGEKEAEAKQLFGEVRIKLPRGEARAERVYNDYVSVLRHIHSAEFEYGQAVRDAQHRDASAEIRLLEPKVPGANFMRDNLRAIYVPGLEIHAGKQFAGMADAFFDTGRIHTSFGGSAVAPPQYNDIVAEAQSVRGAYERIVTKIKRK